MYLDTTPHADDRNKAVVTDYADALADLGVLTPEQYAEVAAHLEGAEAAHVIVSGIESRRADAIATAAEKLTTADLTSEKITAAAVKIADNQVAHDLGLAVWRAHIRDAKTIVLGAFVDVPEVLTARLAEIAERGLAAADAIANVHSAEAAIAAGRTTEWTQFHRAVADYETVTGLVSSLRFDKLIAARGPRDADEDRFAWNFRRRPEQVVRVGLRQGGYTDQEKRALVIEAWKSSPWVPASKDDVAAVIASESVSA